ncbi:YycH family regulatory protein [Sporosarcina luteola]|uniref:YycH family regulatory protein n=1 Tax=Sporosarcina luteola TaxID=582850 RepID=UPI00203FB797|nr:two-component system activity regulator YycH [Sporosarcina luteola]MCM3712331.1 two-component system activity regulator YycH [Sporosarcina luteola]
MGLKYIEPIKSIILLLLVLLSVTFTFSIWTYSPKLATIEQSPTVDISIGERKQVDDIIKPYKFHIKYDESLKGTTDQKIIDHVLKEMKAWKVYQLTPVQNEMNRTQMKAFFEQPNQFTLYFQGDVPLAVYDKILPIEDAHLHKFSFDRLIVKWNPREIAFEAHFIDRATGIHFRGKIESEDTTKSYRQIVLEGEKLSSYQEVDVQEPVYLAVPTEPIKMNRRIYNQEEISPTRFRNALFNDPNAVRRSQLDDTHEEFGDDHARLTVNTESKMLDFAHPAAVSREPAVASDLLLDVIDSINEHGGWTDSFRFSYINTLSRYVKFQLFIHGYPVFGESSGVTEIAQFFGENRVFKYIRPYYKLGFSLPEETMLPSGVDVANGLMEMEKLDFGTVEEITVGYMMKHDLEKRVFVMEPTWFYLMKGNWHPYTPDQGGGEQIGLE